MKERKLIKVLKGFTKQELKLLDKFLLSPLYNSDEGILVLFRYIQKFAPTFSHPRFTEEKAYTLLYPKQSLDEKVLNKQFHKLLKLVEQFIVYLKSRAMNEIYDETIIAHFYNNRSLEGLYEKEYKQLNNRLSKAIHHDQHYFYNQLLKESEQTIYLSKKDKRVGDTNLQAEMNALDAFYLLKKLQLLCLMINRSKIVKFDYHYDLLIELKEYIPRSIHANNPVIMLWYQSLCLLSSPNKEQYYLLKEGIKQHGDLLTKNEARALYGFLENASRVFKEDNIQTYFEEVFELYENQLAKSLLLYNGHFLSQSFKNIITVALRLKKFDWTRDFLTQNKDKILLEVREDVYHYNLAQLYFHQGVFDKVIDLLLKVEYKDIYYLLGAKQVLAKTYYELEEYELLESLLNSFRVFVFRQKEKIAERHILTNQNFINFLSTIYLLKMEVDLDVDKLKSIIKKVSETKELSERNWLNEKLQLMLP